MSQQKPLNPYIAGSALDDPKGFFGREDILRLVETELRAPHQNAVVLFGQRRIGKTSILLQLRRCLSESGFLPIYLDLMDRARRSLGTVLAELADEVALALGLEPPEPAHFDDKGYYFRQEFLPTAYAALGQGEAARRLVFLLDEFDVLDLAAVEELPDTAAARAFFPFIRELMAQEKRLGFVIVVGRKTEELSTDFRAAFRAARCQRVSVLSEQDAHALIHLAEEAGTLSYTAPAEARILALTAGHPYFTQLTCFLLYNHAWAGSVEGVPQVDKADVDTMYLLNNLRCQLPRKAISAPYLSDCICEHTISGDCQISAPTLHRDLLSRYDTIVSQVLEAGNNAFEWVWDGLPPAERIIFSAIAEGTEEGRVLDEDQIVAVLQEHGIRILIRELELAPRTLVQWEMLRKVDGGYCFFIELMRRWVERYKPLARVREELDRVDLVADQLYRLGLTYYRQDNLEAAVEQLREAVTANPNHLQARLLLGQCLRGLGKLAEAIKELEWAYEYDAQASRYELVRTLLPQGERLEKDGLEDEALAIYGRVLEISPRERVARERQVAIYDRRGDAALEAGDYDAALAAYEMSGAQHKQRNVADLRRQGELDVKRNSLGGREPTTISQANQDVLAWCNGQAGLRIHGTTKEQPLVRFQEIEQARLKPLPETPYDMAIWKKVTLARDCYVVFDNAYYSAPHRFIGQELWVCGGIQQVRIYTLKNKLVATHERSDKPGQRQTHPDHLPPHLLPGLLLDRDACLAAAAEVGPATSQVVQSLLGDPVVDRLPSVGRLLRLQDKYGSERLEAACQRAMDGDDPAYKTVKRILAQGLDGQPLPEVMVLPAATTFARPHQELLGALGGESWN